MDTFNSQDEQLRYLTANLLTTNPSNVNLDKLVLLRFSFLRFFNATTQPVKDKLLQSLISNPYADQ